MMKPSPAQQSLQGVTVPKPLLILLNQLYELEKKATKLDGFEKIKRNIDRMKDVFLSELNPDLQLSYEDPMGQAYDDTRSDLDAHIAGSSTDNLVVVDVIKPIIRARSSHNVSQVIQKGIVTVESSASEVTS